MDTDFDEMGLDDVVMALDTTGRDFVGVEEANTDVDILGGVTDTTVAGSDALEDTKRPDFADSTSGSHDVDVAGTVLWVSFNAWSMNLDSESNKASGCERDAFDAVTADTGTGDAYD